MARPVAANAVPAAAPASNLRRMIKRVPFFPAIAVLLGVSCRFAYSTRESSIGQFLQGTLRNSAERFFLYEFHGCAAIVFRNFVEAFLPLLGLLPDVDSLEFCAEGRGDEGVGLECIERLYQCSGQAFRQRFRRGSSPLDQLIEIFVPRRSRIEAGTHALHSRGQ